MSFRDAAKSVVNHFATQWTAVQASLAWDAVLWGVKPSVVHVVYENESYAPAAVPYVRLETMEGDSFQAGLGQVGNRRFRNVGVVLVSILVPKGSGDDIPRQWADLVVGIWRGQKVGGLQFLAPSVDRIGPAGGAWWQINVWAPYYWDENA